ncbi:MAG: response regulator transcription factor [Rhizobacter sp.]|nr:response regulator transcription factor [Rhizobacter sp.]
MDLEASGYSHVASWDASPSLDASPSVAQHVAVIGVARPLMLAGFELLLRRMPGFGLAAREATFPALLAACVRAGDCVVVFDPTQGGSSPRELILALQERAPRARIVLVTDDPSPLAVREAIGLGVLGYVSASDDESELRAALESAAAGRRYLTPAVAARLAESLSLERLTAREMDVLERLSIGACNKAIARELDLAVGTVKSHVRAIMAKLDSRTRTAAVAEACRVGLIRLA